MSQFRIQGGKQLNGTVKVSGSKNAATPILAATLLTDSVCKISNIPHVRDVVSMVEILRRFGAQVNVVNDNTLFIEAKNITPVIDEDTRALMSKMRSSVLFFGPLLARFGEVKLPHPGGCDIGSRSMETHLSAFRDLGYDVELEEKYICVKKSGRTPVNKIVLPEFSVTATENVLMLSAVLAQKTAIHIAATEPHVQDLSRFLVTLGAEIEGIGSHDLFITGTQSLHGGEHRITGDYIEAGTYVLAALCTGGDVEITGIDPHQLHSVLSLLHRSGANIEEGEDSIRVMPSAGLVIEKVQTMPYPGIPTDLQAAFSVLATQTSGNTLIHETLYEGRFRIAEELKKMGAQFVRLDPHRAEIIGPTELTGQMLSGTDLRGSATLVLAGLVARGETIVSGVEHIDRGYEQFDERLRSLGADIQRI